MRNAFCAISEKSKEKHTERKHLKDGDNEPQNVLTTKSLHEKKIHYFSEFWKGDANIFDS